MRRWLFLIAGFLAGLIVGAAVVLLLQAAAPLQPIGAALGFLIGLITGFALILLIATAVSGDPASHRRTFAMIGELLSMPTFWFGGPWLSGTILNLVDLRQVLESYILVLAVIFGILAVYPLIVVVVYLGRRMGDT